MLCWSQSGDVLVLEVKHGEEGVPVPHENPQAEETNAAKDAKGGLLPRPFGEGHVHVGSPEQRVRHVINNVFGVVLPVDGLHRGVNEMHNHGELVVNVVKVLFELGLCFDGVLI